MYQYRFRKRSSGFTLVELLVAVGIIGVLASVSIVSVQSIRGKARDTKRVDDVKQMARILAGYTNPTEVLEGCDAGGSLTTACNARYGISGFRDISGSAAACGNGSAVPCQYTMTIADSTMENYQICFYLEQGGQFGPAGAYKIVDGVISRGCSIE